MQRIWLEEDAKTVEQADVFDGWGRLQYRVGFDDFRTVESLRHPYAMTISDKQGPLWSLDTEKFWAQVSIPESSYTLEASDLEGVNYN